MAKHNLVDCYFTAMRGRDVEGLAGLFAGDAMMILPDGRELGGAGAIRAMYEHLFASDPPVPTVKAVIAGAAGVAVEIEARLADGSSRRTANFFHLDGNGLIRRLSIYMRG